MIKKDEQLPIVQISKVSIVENYFTDQDGYVYGTAKLIQHSKQYKEFDLPLCGIDLRRNAWRIDNVDDFIHHAKRCSDADLKYPILLDHYGTIADGMHRLVKAIVLGKKTIRAIRLETMPTADRVEEKSKESSL